MAKSDVIRQLSTLDDLIEEINSLIPSSSPRSVTFRADLAGLLVVAMAATYETCVKEILCDYASRHHAAFGGFTVRNYERLNSKIRVSDLKKYCETFDPAIHSRFKRNLSQKKNSILERTGSNIETSYEQILNWRHDFAHARGRNTTIEEAVKTHTSGKRILYIFDDAFS
ncbi:HEPN domain-containing protein [Bosea sp. BH3]|uniref:HEPN domain-containing protein n=1 Tax=Bosea sp. BH3 TaxID=2871701 RepID=UPI0021CB8AA5|nr:HEPN domain-containing protein [Bosea sp. BH3]MCU4181655.1 hypothetical protein [Bosea sp. BH3]